MSVGLEFVRKQFPTGDVYEGQWMKSLPEGEGRYKWADGSEYQGFWKAGTKHGQGTYKWPSGAIYKGEWFEGYMHGTGRFDAPDGTYYSGGWAYDRKHGLGEKRYANGDRYEGLWKNGRSHGPGRYRWADESEYDGDWVNGKMHGQGTFVWKSRERYDGQWKEGKEEGMGVFTWANGSRYDGFWHNGKKHGLGVYRPPPPRVHQHHTSSLGSQQEFDDAVTTMSDSTATSFRSHTTDSLSYATSEGPLAVPSVNSRFTSQLNINSNNSLTPVKEQVYLREYSHGKLERQETLDENDVGVLKYVLDQALDQSSSRKKRLFGKQASKNKNKMPGEVIYKGHRSYDLMLSLQLGIRWSVGRVQQQEEPKELQIDEFRKKVKQIFPRSGTPQTPPHRGTDFKWKEYCPMLFRKLRQIFGVDASDYMLNLCGDMALRELVSPGKSGAMFYISHDDRFFIKTMRKNEMKLLLECLPRYFQHVDKYPHTLLTKFYGLHRITPGNGRTVRFVVMGNIFQTHLKLHRRYDLKGSTFGRTAGVWPPPGVDPKDAGDPPVFKDLDLDLEADSNLMGDLRVMDYSLLMGIHYRTGHPESSANYETEDENEFANLKQGQIHPILQKARQKISENKIEGQRAQDLLTIVQNAVNFMTSRKESQRVSGRKLSLTETMRPNTEVGDLGSTEELAFISGQTKVELGSGMVATAVPMDQQKGDSNRQGEDVVLFFGIIDFLQEYNFSKKFEHNFKAITQDSKGVSVTDPNKYAQRFLNFLKNVFV